MKNRAINENRMEISSFSNLNIAEQAIDNTIIQYKVNIDNWIKIPNSLKLEIDSLSNSTHSLGTQYNKINNTFYDCYNSRVVLIKDNKFPENYRILTGFPKK